MGEVRYRDSSEILKREDFILVGRGLPPAQLPPSVAQDDLLLPGNNSICETMLQHLFITFAHYLILKLVNTLFLSLFLCIYLSILIIIILFQVLPFYILQFTSGMSIGMYVC